MSGSDKPYEVGYGKPPKATRFGAGNNANPAGKTSEQKRIEYANAETAMRIRERILQAAEARLAMLAGDEKLVIEEFVEAAMLKLIKDSEDRGLGAPVQDIRSGDGSMTPRAHSDAVLEALKAKHAPKPD